MESTLTHNRASCFETKAFFSDSTMIFFVCVMANLCPDPLMCPWQSAQLCRSNACVSLAQQWFYNTAARWANALDPTCFCFYQMLTQSERRKRLDQNENNAGCCAMCSLRNQEVRKQSTCFRNSIRGTSCLSRPKKHR